jgi:hypothetical protein
MAYTSGGSFLPSDDINFTGQVQFAQTPTFGSGATGALVTTTGTQTLTNKTLTAPTIAGATISGTVTVATGASMINPSITGAVITGTVTIATGAALTNPSITGAVVTGVVTVASGATLTTPTVLMTAQAATATGATGGAGTALSSVTPALVTITGASGAAIDLATGAAVAGAFYYVKNINSSGILNIYAVGGTINGTTGTTAYALDPTGTPAALITCVVAGAWRASKLTS